MVPVSLAIHKGAGDWESAASAPVRKEEEMMSSRRQASIPGILYPDEFAILRDVYSEIVAEDWFSAGEEQRQRFAAYVVRRHQSGTTDPIALLAVCQTVARERFAALTSGAMEPTGTRRFPPI
jgi:ribosomal protein L19